MSVRSLLQLVRLRCFVGILLAFALAPTQGLLLAQAPQSILLSASTAPSQAEPGVTVTNLTGSGFPRGTINASDVNVQLTPVAPAAGRAMIAAASAVTTL